MDSVSIKVTYKGDNILEMDVSIANKVSDDLHRRVNAATAELVRLLLEVSD